MQSSYICRHWKRKWLLPVVIAFLLSILKMQIFGNAIIARETQNPAYTTIILSFSGLLVSSWIVSVVQMLIMSFPICSLRMWSMPMFSWSSTWYCLGYIILLKNEIILLETNNYTKPNISYTVSALTLYCSYISIVSYKSMKSSEVFLSRNLPSLVPVSYSSQSIV